MNTSNTGSIISRELNEKTNAGIDARIAKSIAMFQPIYSAPASEEEQPAQQITGFEALTREIVNGKIQNNPESFLSDVKEAGKEYDHYMHMLKQACRLISNIQNKSNNNHVTVNVNAEMNALYNCNFAKDTKNIMEEYNVSPECIGVEIIETELPHYEHKHYFETKETPDEALFGNTLQSLSAIGVKIALDDYRLDTPSDFKKFQSVVSSRIHTPGASPKVPLDTIKFDRALMPSTSGKSLEKTVKDFGNSSIRTCIELLPENTKIVFEGAETEDDFKFISLVKDSMPDKDVNIQCYAYSKPLNFNQACNVYDNKDADQTNIFSL